MKYKKWPAQRADEDSGNESPTLGSSVESRYSYGLFANQFSDTTDCERSLPRRSYLTQLRDTNSGRLEYLFRAGDSSGSSRSPIAMSQGSKVPLLHQGKINGSGGIDAYIRIPGSDTDQDSVDAEGLLSSVPFFENYKYSMEHKRKQSSLVTVFAVWNTIMGSSLLTMAWGIERAGLLPGILIMLMMGGLCLFTSYILLKVCYHHGDNTECEVSDLCRMLLGRWAEVVAQIFSVVVMLGANIVYWVLMTNFLYYSVNYFRDMPDNITISDPFDGVTCPKNFVNMTSSNPDMVMASWGGKYWDLYSSVPLYVALLIFPLLNFNSTTFFTKFNSLGTLSVLYLAVFVTVKGWGWGMHINSWVEEFTIKTDFSALSGMLALSFFIHNIIITVMRNNRHQENNGRDLSVAFILVTLTYMLVGAVFYICFPLAKNCIEDNILNNFVKSDVMTAVARVLLLFQVITVYPLIAYMLRVQCLGSSNGPNPPTRLAVVMFNTVVVAVCIVFACFVPRIGTIIRYTGAVSGLVHVFTLPSLLQMMSLRIRGKLTIWNVLFYTTIFLIGACNLLAQFFVD